MMGQSGGRSRNNPTGKEARARLTPRERQKIDPPRDLLEPVQELRLTPRGRKLAGVFEYALCIAVGVGMGLLVGVWFLK